MNNVRPIDANSLRIGEYYCTSLGGSKMIHVQAYPLSVVNNAPTLDYAPVIHAKWEKLKNYNKCFYKCSNCNRLVNVSSEEELLSEYTHCCCGAKMDLEDEDNE